MEMHVTVEGRAEAVQEGDQILIGRHSGYHGSSLLDHPFRPPEVHRYQSMGRWVMFPHNAHAMPKP